MQFFRVNAIVIRVREFGEADRLVTLYTLERGKVRAVAKGARRPRNRLSGSTQLFCSGSYACFGGKNLDNLSQGQISEPFIGLREDLRQMAYASYWAELVDVLTEEGEPEEEIYRLLLGAYRQLESGGDAEIIARYFELRLLAILGYMPELARCARCHAPAAGEVYFSPSQGGVLCAGCGRAEAGAHAISPGTVENIKRLLASDLSRLHILKIAPGARGELERTLQGLLHQHLPWALKSLDFLQMVKITERSPERRGEAFDNRPGEN